MNKAVRGQALTFLAADDADKRGWGKAEYQNIEYRIQKGFRT